MGKQLVGRSKLSVDNAPVNKREQNEPVEKLGLLTKETSKMRSYRLRLETIEALDSLTKAVNKKTNIKLSTTNILELLILDAARSDVDKVMNLINSQENK